MHIAMIGHKDFPSRSGGVEVVVYELATRLTKLGHQVTVYNRGLTKPKNRYDCEGVHVIHTWTLKNEMVNAFLYSITATLDAITHSYDLVHYHAAGSCVMIPVAKLFRKCVVATIHGQDWKRAKWGGFASWYLQLGEKMAARFADAVIVLSEHDREYFHNRYHRDCVRIPNGITPVEPLPCNLIRKQFGLTKNGYILFLSRIVPEKGLHYLIEAYQRIQVPEKLVIAGKLPDNDYGKKIQALAQGNENIIFTGFVQGDMIRELYGNCRLFVQPSEIEGLALTLLEALSAGARCLVSDIPENTSVAKSYTLSFQSRDVTDLAHMLKKCLALDPEDTRLKEQQQFVSENYHYESVIRQEVAVYEKAVGSSS